MQISLKWINELINLDQIDDEDLINKLTLGGFEVEEILEIKIEETKTTSLDISTTANRSDSLSIQGLSLEIAALLDITPKVSNYSNKTYLWSQHFEKLLSFYQTANNEISFISLIVENLNNFVSPKWIQEKLLMSGIEPENNLVDFQNYILLETGYPIELYDLDQIYSKLTNKNIDFHLSTPTNSQKFLASNDNEYILNSSNLLLKVNNLPISIAGIISSKSTNYSNSTKSLLVEGSIFNAPQIRKQSRNLGLRTSRSSRYEKSLNNTNLLKSLYRFISLLRINNSKLTCKLHTCVYPVSDSIQILELNYEKIKQVLGPVKKIKNSISNSLSPQMVTTSLNRLQFNVTYDSKNSKWKVKIPPLRNEDIIREIDLIEEIGRIYGFNNFLTRLPIVKKVGFEDFDYQTRKKLTACFTSIGLSELIQYSLVNEKTYRKNSTKLVNPLVKEYSNLRSSLLPNLIKANQENLKRGNYILEGFEYGHVFFKNSSSNIEEKETIAGIFGGIKIKSNWMESYKDLNWFEAKGRIDQLFKKLNIIIYWKSWEPIAERHILHLYNSAEIFLVNGIKLGIFGKISPILAKKLNISTNIYLFEFSFEIIKNQFQQNKLSVYKKYSVYPKIIKDLSFIAKYTVPFTTIKKLLQLNGTKFLKEINLLDEYTGDSILKGHTSLCLQLVFQSDFETLENHKVEKIIKRLTNLLIQELDIVIRI